MTDGQGAVPGGTGERDVTMAGSPVPALGRVFYALGPWITTAVIAAVTSGAICALLLNRAYGASFPEADQIGWMSALAAVGVHPSVAGVYGILLFGGIVVAANVERWTRIPTLGALVVVGLTVAPWALGVEAVDVGLLGGLGVIDTVQSEFAAANLTDDWWLLGLWFGLTWMAGRHNAGVLVAAVWIVALYATWQLGVARVEIWTFAVDQVHDTLPSRARTLEAADQFRHAALLMWSRSAADLFYFLTPMLAIGMLRRREVSTMMIERAGSN